MSEYELLLNADEGNDCKRYYSKYLDLLGEGLIIWQLGHAFLTDKGERRLNELRKVHKEDT